MMGNTTLNLRSKLAVLEFSNARQENGRYYNYTGGIHAW